MPVDYVLLINREWGHYKEISDRDLDSVQSSEYFKEVKK